LSKTHCGNACGIEKASPFYDIRSLAVQSLRWG
jgi:hypothetical protein